MGRRHVHRRALDVAREQTATERSILDLDDQGFQAPSIAARLGISHHEVSRVLRRYATDGEIRIAAEAARYGCEQLLRAQLAAGQHDLPSPIAAALIVAKGIRPSASMAQIGGTT